MKKLAVLSICITLVFCVSFATSAMASDEDEVLQVLEDSVKALNNSNGPSLSSAWWHSQKTSMFAPDRPFLTQGWEDTDKIIKELTETPAGTYNFSLHHPQVTMLGDNVAFTTAYLTLIYTDPETNAQAISQARQTLIFQKVDRKWLVVHNHSSMLPTE